MRPMRKIATLLIVIAAVSLGCSSEEKKSDLPQEMAAKKLIMEIKLLMKQNNNEEAAKQMARLEKEFGHTRTYEEEKAGLYRQGLSPENQDISLTGKRLVEMENALIAFRNETGEWPAPGQIHKPLDAWGNEVYWILGSVRTTYDIVVVSAGPDGKPGSGDELMLVWAEEDLGGYKDKRTGKMVGKTRKTKKSEKAEAKADKQKVVTLEELKESELSAGTKPEDIVSLEDLAQVGERSRKAGQPRKGEMVMSLDEIRDNMGQ